MINLRASKMVHAAVVASLVAPVVPAQAETPFVLVPGRVGRETARYDHGTPSVQLRTPAATIEIRPLPLRKGQAAFQIAVFNNSTRPDNFGTENVTATVNGYQVPAPTFEQIAADAETKARRAKIASAMLGGGALALASTASNHGTSYHHVSGPHGGFTSVVHWQDDTPRIVGSAVAVIGTAITVRGIDAKLDYTLTRLDDAILQTTTVDPKSSFGGIIVVPIERDQADFARIRLMVTFNGVNYPFAFRLAPSGFVPSPSLPATAEDDTFATDAGSIGSVDARD